MYRLLYFVVSCQVLLISRSVYILLYCFSHVIRHIPSYKKSITKARLHLIILLVLASSESDPVNKSNDLKTYHYFL